MKSIHIYILCILLLLVILFAVEYSLPKSFIWRPTFAHTDYQPFGCAIFDDVVSTSLPQGYEVCNETFYQIKNREPKGIGEETSPNILAIAQELKLTQVDREALFAMVSSGSKAVLVASSFNRLLQDTLGFKTSSLLFDINYLKRYISGNREIGLETIHWCDTASVYPPAQYTFLPHLLEAYFYDCDSLNTTLSKDSYPMAITQKMGQGEITLVSTPLLFTNYGMLDNENAAYLFRLLSRLKDAPTVRVVSYETASMGVEEIQTPFRYILEQPPLRWALYTTMLTLLLFVLFSMRRQQRAIPVIRKPQNKSLEFTELIGTLYHQKGNTCDLVHKKYIYFADTLRRTIRVDVEETQDESELAERIAHHTGIEKNKIEWTLRRVLPVVRGEKMVLENEMKNLIDELNEIIKHL